MAADYYKVYLSECIGTALLLLVGLSIVIFNNGQGSIVVKYIPDAGMRRLITGFLFGGTGCLITLSPVGKISGAHINPVVSIAFFLKRKLTGVQTLCFIAAQMLGAAIGSVFLLLWGAQGKSLDYGATIPGPQGIWPAFTGEVITTFCLIAGIFFFTGKEQLKNYTPYLMPVLYCIMVYLEGPYSGASTNPARSFGPALVSGVWTGYWLFWVAPLTGTVIAVALFEMEALKTFRTRIAKLYHFHHDITGMFTRNKQHLESN